MHQDLELIIKSDAKTISRIYKENRQIFLNFAKKYDLSEDDAKDVYQDTIIAFHDNIVSGKLTQLSSSISTYLIAIGKYKIFEKMRANNKLINDEYILEKNIEIDTTIEELNLAQESLNEKQKLLKNEFKNLGKKCQELLTLFYYKSLSIKEIKEVGGYNSENVVKSAKSRCLKQLKESLTSNRDKDE